MEVFKTKLGIDFTLPIERLFESFSDNKWNKERFRVKGIKE